MFLLLVGVLCVLAVGKGVRGEECTVESGGGFHGGWIVLIVVVGFFAIMGVTTCVVLVRRCLKKAHKEPATEHTHESPRSSDTRGRVQRFLSY
jgi:hypothetical protein